MSTGNVQAGTSLFGKHAPPCETLRTTSSDTSPPRFTAFRFCEFVEFFYSNVLKGNMYTWLKNSNSTTNKTTRTLLPPFTPAPSCPPRMPCAQRVCPRRSTPCFTLSSHERARPRLLLGVVVSKRPRRNPSDRLHCSETRLWSRLGSACL